MLRKILLSGLLLSMMGCTDTNVVFHEFNTLKNGFWKASDTVKFKFSILDDTDNYNLFFNVRNDEDYAFSNLFLITHLESPNGEVVIDTLEYEMAKPSGEWLGNGMGSIKESKLWYKEGLKINDTGFFKVKIRHAMRKNGEVRGIKILKGITDLGLEIEQVK